MVGLAWVERVCGGGSTAGVSSSELKRGSGGVLKWGSMEKAKGGEESLAGAFGARVRARRGRRALQWALHGGVAVAAAGRFWAAWRSGEAPAQAKEDGGEHQGDAWKSARRRTWPGAAIHGGRRCTAATAGEQRKELEVEEKGPKHNFQKFQGPVCKPAITFKIGLK